MKTGKRTWRFVAIAGMTWGLAALLRADEARALIQDVPACTPGRHSVIL